jgi:hypothetical protein
VSDIGKLNAEWRALFTKYPGRFLVGSDTWVMQRWHSYPEIMGLYRRWLGELPSEVAIRIAWNNGAQLFGVESLSPALGCDHTDGARCIMMNVTRAREFPMCRAHCEEVWNEGLSVSANHICRFGCRMPGANAEGFRCLQDLYRRGRGKGARRRSQKGCCNQQGKK